MHGFYITRIPSAGKLKGRVCAFLLRSELEVTVLPVTVGKSTQAPQKMRARPAGQPLWFPPTATESYLR